MLPRESSFKANCRMHLSFIPVANISLSLIGKPIPNPRFAIRVLQNGKITVSLSLKNEKKRKRQLFYFVI
jgi:hypothetical protein